MDRKLLDDKRVYKRDDRNQPADDQSLCQDSRQSQEEKEAALGNLVGILSTTADHYFPRFKEWLGELSDSRDEELIEYSRQTIVWAELVGIITKRESRKRISDQMRSEMSWRNLKELSGQKDLEGVPHADTLEYFNTRAKEEEFEGLLVKMIGSLLRSRALESTVCLINITL